MMQVTRDELSSSDYHTLFTRDPGSFIEAIIINLLWSKDEPDEMRIIARQRYVFEQWLKYYTESIKEDMDEPNIDKIIEIAQLRGALDALNTLPMKRGKKLDLEAMERWKAELEERKRLIELSNETI